MSNDLTKTNASLPSIMDHGEGFEGVNASRDLIIPRLTILQGLSPQVNKTKSEYIAGAGAGDICDTGMGEVLKSPLKVIPILYRVRWLEWAPRNSGGGLVAIHDDASVLERCTRDEKNRPTLNGNMVSESAEFFVTLPDYGDRRAFVSFAATQRKKAKRWLTLALGERVQTPDGKETTASIYSRQYLLTTVSESNNLGDWSGWKIERGDKATDEQVAQAKIFRSAITSGFVKAADEPAAHTVDHNEDM